MAAFCTIPDKRMVMAMPFGTMCRNLEIYKCMYVIKSTQESLWYKENLRKIHTYYMKRRDCPVDIKFHD